MLALAYNTNGFAHHDLESCLDILAELGYAGVGLTLDVQHLNPLAAGLEDEARRVARGLERRGLRSVVETGARFLLDPRRKHEPTLVSPDEGARAARLRFYERAVDVAALLGSEAVSVWAGRLRAGADPAAALGWLEAGLARLLEYAAPRGIPVAFEPEPGMLVDDLAGFERLADRLGPALRLTLDLGHVRCTEPDQDIPAAVRRSARRLANVHVEDIRGREHVHLPPGEGDIDFPPALAALEAAGYRGLVQVELSRQSHEAPDAARRAIQFLKQAMQKRTDA